MSGENCPICDDNFEDEAIHVNTVSHRFNYYLYEYDKNRKGIFSDRDGVKLEVSVVQINGFNYNFDSNTRNKKPYYLHITPQQFRDHNNQIEFLCKITNLRTGRRDNIIVLYAGVLHPYPHFTISDTNNFLQHGRMLEITPEASFEFKVKLSLEECTVGKFKIPIYLSIQTGTGTEQANRFSIARSIVVAIHDAVPDHDLTQKSPFTSEKWRDVRFVLPTKITGRDNGEYCIPNQYRRTIFAALNRDYGGLPDLLTMLSPGCVTLNNYRNFFHVLVWLEEAAAILALSCYNMEKVKLKMKSSDIAELEVPGLAEKRPSVIKGDLIHIRVHSDHTAYVGQIRNVGDKTVEIQYLNQTVLDFISNNPDVEMDVEFVLSRIHFERMHRGVNLVADSGFVRNLFPDVRLATRPVREPITVTENEFFNTTVYNNREQRTAVTKILNNTSNGVPYIVYGPPGTGKTVTIVEAIYQLKRKTNLKILVCAPANAACNMIAERLLRFCPKEELIRVMSDSCDKSIVSEGLLPYSNVVRIEDAEQVINKTAEELLTYRIVVTTLVLAGKYSRSAYRPDVLFIDEAAQAREPEACCAIGLLRNGARLVLAGDHNQLGPVVDSKICREYHYHVSILERLMNLPIYIEDEAEGRNNFTTKLKLNFRSHPEILKLPNRYFYENELRGVSPQALRDPIGKVFIFKANSRRRGRNFPVGSPVEFCSVYATEQRQGRSPSYYNQMEVQMVHNYVEKIISLQFDDPNDNVKADEIGVVTPYIRQVYKIRDTLSRNYSKVEVGTTEAFQGREKRIIIISCVRAQEDLLLYDKKYKLGFVKEPKRFNVACTRAKSKLIVIGNPLVLSKDEKWRDYMELCKANCCFGGAPHQERTQDVMNDIVQRMNVLHFNNPIPVQNRPR